MTRRRPAELQVVLDVLATLADEDLRRVIARAQALLLDRPTGAPETIQLTVEVVDREESRLLTSYRALGVLDQQRICRYVARQVGRPRAPGAATVIVTDASSQPPGATPAPRDAR